MDPILYFVTPAYRRYEVSHVCFSHRAWTIERMQEAGIDARCVVIADDENLELAKDFGFDTVEHGYDGYHDSRGRQYIGRKFNDGYEYAANHGAKYVVPIGSDSWIHPCFFSSLPIRPREIQTSQFYAIVSEDGDRMARLEIPIAGGVGPNVIPTALMRTHKYRPVVERLHRGHDTSLMRSFGRRNLSWKWIDIDPLQYFAFRVRGEQLNSYERLASKYAVGESETPWEDLALLHPPELVYRGRAIYQKVLI